MNAPQAGALAAVAAFGAFYITVRIVLRRKLANETYRRTTVARMNSAPWRRHSNVTYLNAQGYTYAPNKPQHPEGGGSDAPRLGLVTGESLAGGKGSQPDLPCKYCGTLGGHTAQCPVVSTRAGGTNA